MIIDNPLSIYELIRDIETHDFIAYDCETTGVHKGAEIIGLSFCMEETKAYYVIISKWNNETNELEYIEEATDHAQCCV